MCNCNPPDWLSQAGGRCEKVKQEPQVAVVVVDVIELPEELLPVVADPILLLLGGPPQQLLVVLHELSQDPQVGAQQPTDGEEGADQVNTEHYQRGEQNVEVKLRRHSRALIVCFVYRANWIKVSLNFKDAGQQEERGQPRSNEEFKQSSDHVVLVKISVLLERLPDLNSLDSIVHVSCVIGLGDALVYFSSLGCTDQGRESFYLGVGAKQAIEEALDANEDHGEDEEDVGEVLGELADGVLGAVVPHVPGLVTRVPGAGQIGATLVILIFEGKSIDFPVYLRSYFETGCAEKWGAGEYLGREDDQAERDEAIDDEVLEVVPPGDEELLRVGV